MRRRRGPGRQAQPSEKPLATVPADAAAMVEEARKAGVTLELVHNYLFQPEIVLARELIGSEARWAT
jgi:predicted dehydrogenase